MQSVAPTGTYSINDDKVKIHPCDNSSCDKLDDMIAEYQLFHDRWMEGLKKLRDKESAADGASKRCVADNGNADMVFCVAQVLHLPPPLAKKSFLDFSREEEADIHRLDIFEGKERKGILFINKFLNL